MVPYDYWTAERILQHKSRLNRHAKMNLSNSTTVPNETFVLELLIPVKYKKANLKQITHNCIDLTPKPQSKLLHTLPSHEALFLSKQGK